MAVRNGSGGRSWNATRQGRRRYGRERGACRAFGPFAVRAKKYASRARVPHRSFEISTYRLSYAHLRLDKIGKRCRTFARSRISGNSPRTAGGDGPQEYYGHGLVEAVTKYDRAYPGRFYTFTEPSYSRFKEPEYPKLQAQAIERASRDGGRGLKILKTLGLYLRENITTGSLVKIDDARFDPMWDACGQMNLPVAIHISDPIAFFTPTDCFNERYEELNNHPDWSFCGGDFPSNDELIAARNRVIARHPQTQFVVVHVGNFAEDLQNVSENLDRCPNMFVDLAARIGELGRQPRTAGKFFDKYQDRILFGTDATPHGDEFPQQVFNDKLYEIYFRFLETEDEYFDYAPAKIPPQGRWRIYGIGLPESILKKVYYENSARILHI